MEQPHNNGIKEARPKERRCELQRESPPPVMRLRDFDLFGHPGSSELGASPSSIVGLPRGLEERGLFSPVETEGTHYLPLHSRTEEKPSPSSSSHGLCKASDLIWSQKRLGLFTSPSCLPPDVDTRLCLETALEATAHHLPLRVFPSCSSHP